MALVTKSLTPLDILPGVKTEFMKAYKDAPMDWQRVATTVNSTLSVETYAWLGQSPQVREFIGERVPKGLSEFGFTLKNRKWENTLAVDRDDLEDEQYGQIKIRAGQLGNKAAQHRNILTWQLFAAGATNVCYDGSNFFDTTHTENQSGTQVNKGTTALSATSYGAARALMMGFKDDTGILIGIRPTLLIVSPQNEQVARQILTSDFVVSDTVAAAQSNIWKGTAELLVVPWLTDSNDWFLVDDTQFIKPMIFQVKEEMSLKYLDGSSDSERAFMRDEFLYGTRARYNVGYGDWRPAFGSIVSGS